MNDNEMKSMLIEYMGNGFLDNIIALFKQDPSLYHFLPDMLEHENLRVRLGATALVEELVTGHREELRTAVPGLLLLLGHESATTRGDAANVLGIIGDRSTEGPLRELLGDGNAQVRELAGEALDAMRLKQ